MTSVHSLYTVSLSALMAPPTPTFWPGAPWLIQKRLKQEEEALCLFVTCGLHMCIEVWLDTMLLSLNHKPPIKLLHHQPNFPI